MCKISIETVIRANKRTISQNRYKQFGITGAPVAPREVFNVSVSARGRMFTQSISAKQIKESFGKAIDIHVKKL